MFFFKLALLALLAQVGSGEEGLLPVALRVPPVDYPDTSAANNPGQYTCPVEPNPFVNRCIESSMNYYTSGGSSGYSFIPPDTHGAAGPASLCAVTNVAIHCINKDGSDKPKFPVTGLFDLFSGYLPGFDFTVGKVFDPKIIYDFHESRFVLVVLYINYSRTVSKILVAVSKTENPATPTTSDWYTFEINSLIDGTWVDYPGLAVDEEAIYITNNMYDSANVYQKNLVWIIPKSPVYSGGSPTSAVYDFVALGGLGDYGIYMPAMVRASSGIPNNMGTYFVKFDGSLAVCWIKNPLSPSPTDFGCTNVATPNISPGTFLNAPQPGTTARISTNDDRALQAVWVKNALWMVTTVAQANSETAAYWIKMTANGSDPPVLDTHGPIDGEDIQAGTWTYMASLDVNSKGIAVFGFTASASTNIYASAYATVRDQTGTVRKPQLIQAGLGPYNITLGGTRNRWGDYSGTALDPTNENCFWTYLEYAGDTPSLVAGAEFGHWRTVWGRVCFTPPLPTKAPTKSPTNAPIKTPTKVPTRAPTTSPTKARAQPTKVPNKFPTKAPIKAPSKAPVQQGGPTHGPTKIPTKAPSIAMSKPPTKAPTRPPTKAPIKPPTKAPTKAPIKPPTKAPIKPPTKPPTKAPTTGTKAPAPVPTQAPTVVTISFRVFVLYDDNPTEFAWKIRDSTVPKTVVNYPQGSVVEPNTYLKRSLNLIPGHKYRLVARDASGDGLGTVGYIKIYKKSSMTSGNKWTKVVTVKGNYSKYAFGFWA